MEVFSHLDEGPSINHCTFVNFFNMILNVIKHVVNLLHLFCTEQPKEKKGKLISLPWRKSEYLQALYWFKPCLNQLRIRVKNVPH